MAHPARGARRTADLAGALLYALYNYLDPLFRVPFGVAFLLDLALVALSAYTIIALIAVIDGRAVRERLERAAPDKFGGGLLAASGALVLVRAASLMIAAVLAKNAPEATELATNVTDILIAPAWIVGGITTTDFNLWGGASGHTYTFTRKPNGTTDIDVAVVREGRNLRGRLLGFVLGTIGRRVLEKAFEESVKAIEARNSMATAHAGS